MVWRFNLLIHFCQIRSGTQFRGLEIKCGRIFGKKEHIAALYLLVFLCFVLGHYKFTNIISNLNHRSLSVHINENIKYIFSHFCQNQILKYTPNVKFV